MQTLPKESKQFKSAWNKAHKGNLKNYSPVASVLYADGARSFLDGHFKSVSESIALPESAARRVFGGELASHPKHAAGALGNNAKIQAAKEKPLDTNSGDFRKHDLTEDGVLITVDHETGEIRNFDVSKRKLKQIKDLDAIRGERYRLQTQAAALLPKSRTARCLRLRQRGQEKENVKVFKSVEHGKCTFGGLQTCGSVWSCPVCAAKVSARRGGELLHAMRQHHTEGGFLVMVTLTVPHQKEDDLEVMLEALSQAQMKIKGQRQYKKLVRLVGRIGTVKALEVTHGLHGWHPHIHELWFIRNDYNLSLLQTELFKEWQSAAVKAGFDAPDRKHGVNVTKVTDLEKAAEYLRKEMTMAHTKAGHKLNRTPFDLLRQSVHDAYAGALFVEYAEAFSGSHQLQWSRGLKKMFEVVELTDEQIAAVQDDSCAEVGEITPEDWKMILRVERKYPALSPRSAVLGLASVSWDKAQAFINSLSLFGCSSGSRSRLDPLAPVS